MLHPFRPPAAVRLLQWAYLEAVPVSQSYGLFALPSQGSPTHAYAQAKLRDIGRGSRRRQRVGRQRHFDHALSKSVERVRCVENAFLAAGDR